MKDARAAPWQSQFRWGTPRLSGLRWVSTVTRRSLPIRQPAPGALRPGAPTRTDDAENYLPWCGPRAESEFCGGEAHIARPLDTDALDDRQWGDYLFMRKNPKGQHFEQWHHSQGCRRWFNAERDTVSYRFKQFYKPGESPQGGAAASSPPPIRADAVGAD